MDSDNDDSCECYDWVSVHRPFTTGKTQQHILEVEGSTARLILRKAVATICAHTGYTDTSESVLRLLTDVTHEFLIKITGVLRANTDNLLLTDRCPFHVSLLSTHCSGQWCIYIGAWGGLLIQTPGTPKISQFQFFECFFAYINNLTCK